MAEKSLFFNALADASSATGYDRNYNADDISDWLGVVFENGVIKTDTQNNEPQGLKVVATTGMVINVKAGKAAIKGKAYINNSIKSFTVATAPTGANARYDLVVLRFDNNLNERNIKLELRQGYTYSTAPTDQQLLAQLTRSADVHELLLAYIKVEQNAQTITQAVIRDLRGNSTLCGWFTAVKGYEEYYDAIVQKYESVTTMAATGVTVVTNLPSNLYNTRYSIINVYTNGMKEANNAYSVTATGAYITITFTTAKSVGAKITVELGNYIDGEGMTTALAGYTQFTQAVAKLTTAGEYDYLCNGTNDNILISNLVNTFSNAADDYGSMKLNIIGTFGYTAMYGGGGTSSNPYKLFDFVWSRNRKVTLDFTRCSQLTVNPTGGTYTIIFNTNNINIVGLNLSSIQTSTGTTIRVFNNSNGTVKCTDCRFWVNGYIDSIIACVGTFENCRGSVSNVTSNSYAFLSGYTGILRLFGGEYYAYTGQSSARSAVVGQSSAQSLAILYGVNMPTTARNGYYQTNSILQYGGWVNCTDLISNLALSVISGQSNIRGTIQMEKPNQM